MIASYDACLEFLTEARKDHVTSRTCNIFRNEITTCFKVG